MPIPDPHANEPTQEVDPDIWRLYREAQVNAEGWTKEANRLKEMIQKQVGDAYAATINGSKVATWRPQEKYATSALRQEYPDLTDHFMRHTVQVVFDVEAFAARHPDIAEKYRIRSFRSVT